MDQITLKKDIDLTINKIDLQNDFNKAFPPFIIYLATIIILISFSKDIVKVGFNLNWLLIRLGYFPFILIIWNFSKYKLQNKYYEMPLWAAGLYITSLCTYFSFSTGGLSSDYIFGLLQLYFAIALMPITAITFYAILFFSTILYFGFNLYKVHAIDFADRSTISTSVPLIIFSIIVYMINSNFRRAKLALQEKLRLTIEQRDVVIQQQSIKLAETETKGALGVLAAQVAHDIRSPLAALNILTTQDTPVTEQSKVLVRNAVNRIRDIANDIVDKNRDLRRAHININNTSTQLLAAIIYPIITEKRLQFRSSSEINIELELTPENYGLFVNIKLSEFKRMLSNIIENAIEALSGKGTVYIRIHYNNNLIHLSITDNGKGIPASILSQLGQYGVTYNKQFGSGLGLYHAKKTMEQLGGKLEIVSELGKGTDVILVFPHAPIPRWFYPEFEITKNSTLVILDDDITIHQLWRERFKNVLSNISIINFTSPIEFFDWRLKNETESTSFLYLVDLEFLGHSQTGIKIIEEFNIQKNSVLVTSHFENRDIHEKCEKLGIKIIPKDLAVFVPIKVE
jgi:signal transduction histidine kinase